MKPTRIGPNTPAAKPMAFLSDIHGNLTALDAVLGELKRRDVGRIYVAGDMFLGGDEPLAVWRRLHEVEAICIRGVSDTALVTLDPEALRGRDDAESERLTQFRSTREALGELVLHEVRKLPERLRIPLIDGREILMVHGSPADPRQEISHDMEEDEVRALVNDDVADIVVCGASHVPFRIPLDENEVLSVGSVGEAPEGRFAHFAVLTPRMGSTDITQDFVEY
jgi:predicted phosphodiesterase